MRSMQRCTLMLLATSAAAGDLSVEWLDPDTGKSMTASTVQGGGPRRLTAPFPGHAVLHVRRSDH